MELLFSSALGIGYWAIYSQSTIVFMMQRPLQNIFCRIINLSIVVENCERDPI